MASRHDCPSSAEECGSRHFDASSKIDMPTRSHPLPPAAVSFLVSALGLIAALSLAVATADAHPLRGVARCTTEPTSTSSRPSRQHCAAPQARATVKRRDARTVSITSARHQGGRLLSNVGLRAGPSTPADPSGAPVPRGNVQGWDQVFAESFKTSVPLGGFSGCVAGPTLISSACSGLPSNLRSRWWAYPDGWQDTEHHGIYSPSRVLSIHNGVLDYYLHTVDGTPVGAALVPKIPGGIRGGGLLYGAYVVRFRAEPIRGYKTAWLLWPDREVWPAEGEVDFPEGDLSGDIDAFMHHSGAASTPAQDVYPTTADYNAWHTAIIEWTPGNCRFILDGQQIGASSESVPRDPMHWVLQTETATDGSIPTASASGHVLIAWVAAYTPS